MPPDVQVEIRNIATGHPCIVNRTNWIENGNPVVELACAIAQEGFDGIWRTDFDICGIETARESIDIPIIGGFPTLESVALMLSQRFSVVAILQSTLAMQRAYVLTDGG